MKHAPLLHAVSLIALLSTHMSDAESSPVQGATTGKKATKNKPTRTFRSLSANQKWGIGATIVTTATIAFAVIMYALHKKHTPAPDALKLGLPGQGDEKVKDAGAKAGLSAIVLTSAGTAAGPSDQFATKTAMDDLMTKMTGLAAENERLWLAVREAAQQGKKAADDVLGCEGHINEFPTSGTLDGRFGTAANVQERLQADITGLREASTHQADQIATLEDRPIFDDKAHAAVVKAARTDMATSADLTTLRNDHNAALEFTESRFIKIFGATSSNKEAADYDHKDDLAQRLTTLEQQLANGQAVTGTQLNAFNESLQKHQSNLLYLNNRLIDVFGSAQTKNGLQPAAYADKKNSMATRLAVAEDDRKNLQLQLSSLARRQDELENGALHKAATYRAVFDALEDRLDKLETTSQAHAVVVHAHQAAAAHGALSPTPAVIRQPDKALAALVAQAAPADQVPAANAEARARATSVSDSAASDAHSAALQAVADIIGAAGPAHEFQQV